MGGRRVGWSNFYNYFVLSRRVNLFPLFDRDKRGRYVQLFGTIHLGLID